MSAGDDEGGVDWRRLASDRNVSHGMARGLWESANAASPHDAAQAELAFNHMLDAAAAANATHEPGRETLVETKGARDAGSLGPGKSTLVQREHDRPGPAGSARQSPSDSLRDDLLAAAQAGKDAISLLAKSDPATIIDAIRELGRTADPGIQKLMNAAGGAFIRMFDKKSEPAGPAAPTPPATAEPRADLGKPTATAPGKPTPPTKSR